MQHFSFYPKVEYTNQLLVNIMIRGKIRDAILEKKALYYKHYLTDDQTAETISEQYYGNSKYVWAIYYANNILHPTLDWPMSTSVFVKHLEKKYGSLENSYRIIVGYEYRDPETNIVYSIDESTYNKLSLVPESEESSSSVRKLSAYDYEFELNNKKRNIVILDSKYILTITNELKNLFK